MDWRGGIRGSLCGAVSLLSGCAVGPDYLPPAFIGPAAEEVSWGDPDGAAIARWWPLLGDPELNSLVERAVFSNPSIEIALARIKIARANEIAVRGAALPESGASVGAARSTGTNSARGRVTSPLHSGTNSTGLKEITDVGGFDASWEIDLFGKNRRLLEAASYTTDVAVEQRRAVLVSVVAEVAKVYIETRGAQERLRVAGETVSRAEKTFKFVQERFKRGVTNELDASLASRQLATYRAQIPLLTAEIFTGCSRIAVLLDVPSDVIVDELKRPRSIPRTPQKLRTSVSADILRRRPDIRAAERELAVATAQVGVATADLFPRISLTAGGGAQNQGLGRTPVEWKSIYSFGPALYWPLLDFGTLDALLHAQKFRAEEKFINYRSVVLASVEEANVALTRYRAQMAALQMIGTAKQESRRTLDLASERYDRGVTDFLNVLDAQRQEDELDFQYADAQMAAALNFVAIYKALGGGWEMFDELPPDPHVRPAVAAAFRELRHTARE